MELMKLINSDKKDEIEKTYNYNLDELEKTNKDIDINLLKDILDEIGADYRLNNGALDKAYENKLFEEIIRATLKGYFFKKKNYSYSIIRNIFEYSNRNGIDIDLNKKDIYGSYPIIYAARASPSGQNNELVKALIEYAQQNEEILDINVEDDNGFTPISRAIYCCALNEMSPLIQYAKKNNLPLKISVDEISYAIYNGRNTIYDTLMEYAKEKEIIIEMNKKDENGNFIVLESIMQKKDSKIEESVMEYNIDHNIFFDFNLNEFQRYSYYIIKLLRYHKFKIDNEIKKNPNENKKNLSGLMDYVFIELKKNSGKTPIKVLFKKYKEVEETWKNIYGKNNLVKENNKKDEEQNIQIVNENIGNQKENEELKKREEKLKKEEEEFKKKEEKLKKEEEEFKKKKENLKKQDEELKKQDEELKKQEEYEKEKNDFELEDIRNQREEVERLREQVNKEREELNKI